MKKFIVFVLIFSSFVGLAQVNDAGTNPGSSFAGLSQRDVMDSDSFDGTEMTMTPRFGRMGVVGEPCTLFGSGFYSYRTYQYSSDGSGVMTVDFDPGTCGPDVYVTFHVDSFDPMDICPNYFWAYGSSVAFTETFACPPNSTIIMVVNGRLNAPGPICGPYSWAITGLNEGAAIPTLGQWGLIGFVALLALAGVFFGIRQRRAIN